MKATLKKLVILALAALMILGAVACTAKTEPAATGDTKTEQTTPDFPTKEITLIIPYAAGGEGDNIYRCIQESLNEAFGVTVVPEYVGGGNAIPGTQKILDAAGDGYTIGLCAAGALSARLEGLP